MKYCPYCGASLIGGAAFCMECGRSVPEVPAQKKAPGDDGIRTYKRHLKPEEPIQKKVNAEPKKKSGTKRKIMSKPLDKRERRKMPEPVSDSESTSTEDTYDGYYDDVLPSDNGAGYEKMDRNLIKRIVLIGLGAVAIIVAAVFLMQLI